MPSASNGHVHLDHFDVLAQGKLDTLRPSAPVEEGDSVELKLVEVGLYDPTAGVGKLAGGYEVVVSGAAKLVGKKVTATLGSVLEGAAYATLADAAVAAVAPITFEAEAEKPTRASRGKKDVAAIEPETVEPDDVVGAVDEEAADADDSAEPELETEVSADGQPKKKRTRRGTRGGRGRKKPAAAAAVANADGPAGEATSRSAPRIHVPPADLAAPSEEARAAEAPAVEADAAEVAVDGDADAQPKRKRSRRGSRGGKKHRKPAANGDGDAPPPDASSDGEPVEVVADADVPAYVPMSEWIDDFETRSRA